MTGSPTVALNPEVTLERYRRSTHIQPRADLVELVKHRIAAEPPTTAPRRFTAALGARDVRATWRALSQCAAAAVAPGTRSMAIRVQAMAVTLVAVVTLGAGSAVGLAAAGQVTQVITDLRGPRTERVNQPQPAEAGSVSAVSDGVVPAAARADGVDAGGGEGDPEVADPNGRIAEPARSATRGKSATAPRGPGNARAGSGPAGQANERARSAPRGSNANAAGAKATGKARAAQRGTPFANGPGGAKSSAGETSNGKGDSAKATAEDDRGARRPQKQDRR